MSLFRRWPIATSLFMLHAVLVGLVYLWWAMSSSVERGMIWMTVFLIDLPSSYLFANGSDSMVPHAASALFIGGLQWALIGVVLNLIRKAVMGRQSHRGS